MLREVDRGLGGCGQAEGVGVRLLSRKRLTHC